MAATTSGALKALIEAGGLSLSAYRDEAPDAAALPYVVIFEGISITPHSKNNRYQADKQVVEQVQLTLWQPWRDAAAKTNSENPELTPGLETLLDGAELETPTRTWCVKWINTTRFPPNRDANKVQTVITVDLIRDL